MQDQYGNGHGNFQSKVEHMMKPELFTRYKAQGQIFLWELLCSLADTELWHNVSLSLVTKATVRDYVKATSAIHIQHALYVLNSLVTWRQRFAFGGLIDWKYFFSDFWLRAHIDKGEENCHIVLINKSKSKRIL